jgi:hypothetical protein
VKKIVAISLDSWFAPNKRFPGRGFASKVRSLIHTGLQPGDYGPEDSGTVSTVFFLRKSPKRLNARKLRQQSRGKTVATVQILLENNLVTWLKPGVNENGLWRLRGIQMRRAGGLPLVQLAYARNHIERVSSRRLDFQ